MAAVTFHSDFGAQETFSPFIYHEVVGLDAQSIVVT